MGGVDADALIDLPGASFRMGSDDFYPEEGPVREVAVAGFGIERSPVTVAQFAAFVAATGYLTVAERPLDPADYPEADPSLLVPGSAVFQPTAGPVPLNDPRHWWAYVPGASWRYPGGPETDSAEIPDHPVTQVAYEDAEAYARWAGRELPSEAEWEYAARGGLDGCTYAWGEDPQPEGEPMANTWQGQFPWENSGARGWRGTSPVGSFPANGFGLLDMTGNVWEWTGDEYTLPPPTPSPCCGGAGSRAEQAGERVEFIGPGGHIPRRVLKGGSHLCAPSYCLRYRPAARQPEAVDSATSHIGFRCVLRAEAA